MVQCDVLVIGSANLDLVFSCSLLPNPGETLLGHGFATHPGGKGANQAVAAGRLNGKVAMVGCLGDDPNGLVLSSALEEAGVDTSCLAEIAGVSSGTAGIFVGGDGSNMIIVAQGANAKLTAEQVSGALEKWQPSVVLAQLEVPLDALEPATRHSRFILNPAPAQALSKDLLSACFALTPNETELEALTGIAPNNERSCGRAARTLLDKGVGNVVVTLGERGCYWCSKDGGQRFPARVVQAIDTTAAGDAFNGALALFLAQGADFGAAIERANAVAALSTTRVGAQGSMPTLEEVKDFAPEVF